jgi:hypothetical protein
MTYTSEDIEEAVEEFGEILVVLDSDAYDGPLELHLHDTTFDHSANEVVLELADGRTAFPASAIESRSYHEQTTDEIGL